MQRLVDRIYREFAANGKYLEINALDGNGDSFRVYQGEVGMLTVQNFVHVLREPLCFYFFNVTCIVDGFDDDNIIRRDLCWLTDPLPPRLEEPLPHGLTLAWNPVKFCGVNAPSMLESVSYTIEIAEGVEWKEGMISRYMNDTTATAYRPIFKGKNIHSTTLQHLKPATWYHARMIVDYLGLQVMSESITMHTLKAEPSPPGAPKITLVPISDPFDVKNVLPSRYEIMLSWTASQHHGSPIEKYQVHLKRFDLRGTVLLNEPNLIVKKRERPLNSQRTISILLGGNKANNQWIQSPGKNEVLIRHSLKTREQKRSQPSASSVERGIAALHGGANSRSNSRGGSPVMTMDAFGAFPLSNDELEQDRVDTAPSSSSGHAWKIIYDKLPRTMKLYSPGPEDGEWWFRVRAKNAGGWSAFSAITSINHSQYPSIFSEPMKVLIPRPLEMSNVVEQMVPNGNTGMFFQSGLSSPGTSGKSTYSSTAGEGMMSQSGDNSKAADLPMLDAERPVTRLNRQYGSIDPEHNHQNNHPFSSQKSPYSHGNTDDMTMTTISTNTNMNTAAGLIFERRQSNAGKGSANNNANNVNSSFLPEIRKR